jgi:phage shock protein A
MGRFYDLVKGEVEMAQAYGDMAKRNKSVDEEINKAIGDEDSKVNQELGEIKKRLGI